MREPRGHQDMFGVFLTPPHEPDADAGMLWMDGERFVEMCGHGTIALSMVMVTHRLLHNIVEPISTIRYETPVGRVTAEVKMADGKAEWTRFENVPAFVLAQDVPVTLPGYGDLKADISFGGNFFAQIKWPDKERRICPENGRLLSDMGELVKKQINARMQIQHPTKPDTKGLHFCTFWHEPDPPDLPLQKRPRVLGRQDGPLAGWHRHQCDDGDVRGTRTDKDGPDHPLGRSAGVWPVRRLPRSGNDHRRQACRGADSKGHCERDRLRQVASRSKGSRQPGLCDQIDSCDRTLDPSCDVSIDHDHQLYGVVWALQ